MKNALKNIRRFEKISIPDGKYEGEWVGTQVYFTAHGVVYEANTTEHRQSKVAVWVRVKGGCATCEIKQ